MKPTLTIGIPAYNEAKNIQHLLRSILLQNSRLYSLKSIIVSSDGSTDDTVPLVKSLHNSKIRILANNKRQGIARGLNQIISLCKSEVLVTLDADIVIKSSNFIDALVRPIINGNVDHTSSAIKYIQGKTAISRALQVGTEIKQVLFDQLDDHNNIYHCYGLARAYSRRLYADMVIPVSVGNDMYTYLYCHVKNYKFCYVKNATAWYKLPANLKDHMSQSHRFVVSGTIMESLFGVDLVRQQLKIPVQAFVKATLFSILIFISQPLTVVNYIKIQIIARLTKHKAVNQAWTIAESSK